MTIIKVITITGAIGWASHLMAASSLMRISLPKGLITAMVWEYDSQILLNIYWFNNDRWGKQA